MNANTSKDLCLVQYRDLNYAIETCLKLLEHRLSDNSKLFYAKTDAKSAFRVLPIRIDQCCWLILMAVNPMTNKKQYFVDKCLPFGASISCAQFQKFSDALQYLAEYKIQVSFCITNYLDDFLFVAWMKVECDRRMSKFLRLCRKIGRPIVSDKTEWGTSIIIFLGCLLDGEEFCIAIPQEKKDQAINQLQTMINKKKVLVRELQSLIGLLNFLCRAIVPGRVFTRRMYAKIPGYIYELQQKRKLKHYHHVSLDREFKQDCCVWLNFLKEANNNRKLLCRPFIDWTQEFTATELRFYMDATANEFLGFGALYQNNWTFGVWEAGFIKEDEPSIEYLELFTVCVGIFAWGHLIKDKRVMIFCDNQAVVHMINNSSSSCKNCMYLLRMLVTNNLIHNRWLFARYIRSADNDLADALSRQDLKRFWRLAPPGTKSRPDLLPSEIWPMSKLWQS